VALPPLPCSPAERASANEGEDLPLTTSGARPTGMLHLHAMGVAEAPSVQG